MTGAERPYRRRVGLHMLATMSRTALGQTWRMPGREAADGPAYPSSRRRAAGISKLYGRGATLVRALDAVDLVVEHGDYLAVMGASGSGKSTLMNIIGCLDVPTRPVPPRRRRRPPASTSAAGDHPQPQDRVRLPVVQPDPAHDRAGQRRAAAGLRGVRPARAAQARAGRARSGSGSPTRRATCPRAVGRAAAARGDRAGDRHRPGAAAGRRADRARSTAAAPRTCWRCSTGSTPRAGPSS